MRKHLFGFQVTPIGEQRGEGERSDETADRERWWSGWRETKSSKCGNVLTERGLW